MATPWKLVLAAVVAIVLVAVARGCVGGGEGTLQTPDPAASSTRTGNQAGTHPAGIGGGSQGDVAGRARVEAMQAAIDTLHRYLAAVGGTQPGTADDYWADGRVPAASDEADLRALQDLRALRIENGAPVALDSEAVPGALEIPVELRATFAKAAPRGYSGRYRLRRAIDGARWEITSADVDVVPPQR